MSKRKTAKTNKKINFKLRKQVRRTFGVLFMASAIVVSAIPVGDIEAGVKWEDAVARADDNRGSAAYPTIDQTSPGWVASQTFLERPADSALKTSYTIYEMSSSATPWTIVDQYYYSVHSGISGTSGPVAIINGYSSMLPAGEISMSNYLAREYYLVTEQKFNDFFQGAQYDDGTNNASWPGGGAGSKVYSFKYSDYKNAMLQGKTEDMLFIEAQPEWQNDYNRFTRECEAYYNYEIAKAAYDAAHAQWVIDSIGDEPTAPTVVPPPGGAVDAEFTRSPADLDTEQKLRFYCEWAESLPLNDSDRLPGRGFTLMAVNDQRSGGNSSTLLYVAKGGQLTGEGGVELDGNGFLVTSRSEMVIGIGKEAFYDVDNVTNLVVPSEIKYIGDSAFESSFIQSIVFTNVLQIGNKAFKNCIYLTSISIEGGARAIGAEAFRGTNIQNLVLPATIDIVGAGAFAYAQNLQTADLSNLKQNPTTIGPYAFYDCPLLNSIPFPDSLIGFDIGDGCFALHTEAPGFLTTVTLPSGVTGGTGRALGNYLFQGRQGLKSVIMPSSYGSDRNNGVVKIPSGMFKDCTGLEFVEFPNIAGGTNGGYASYQYEDVSPAGIGPEDYMGQYLFLDVTNPDFYVRGPELFSAALTGIQGQKALPRRSTWSAYTRVSDFIPYLYTDSSGTECYEVSDGQYILQANENGELTDCELVEDGSFNGSNYVDLIIPSTVGDIKITDIASDALSNRNLRDRMRSLTIADNSLTTIAAGAFKGLPRLEEVVIGNSVQNIGDEAFMDCTLLTDVTFHSPSFDHELFVIGNDAFKTNSRKLIFNGDIELGYAPFDFAMDPLQGNIAYDINGDPTGLRILYKSLSPTLLTVMYDNDAEEVVLLNYPKFDRLDANNPGYLRNMERYYTELYEGSPYNQQRTDFVAAFTAAGGDPDQEAALYENPALYGPWLSRAYLDDPNGDGSDADKITGIEAYYERNPYSIIDNFNNTNPQDWERASLTESAMVNATKHIVIPAGITSIDAQSYFDTSNGRVNSNRPNFSVYFNPNNADSYINQDEYNMIMGDPANSTENEIPVVSGLFSGYYTDFNSAHPNEQQVRGNDQIESVTMSTVKSLPAHAFDSCESLKQVTLGDALMDIGTAPFRGASNLSIVIGNEKYLVDKGIIYSRKPDESYRIEQTLSARGALVGESYVTSETDPLIVNVSEIAKGAFEDCDVLNRVDLTDADLLKIIPEDCFNDCKVLRTVRLPESVSRIEAGAFGLNDSLNVYIPGYEVHIATDAFKLLSKTADPTTSHIIQTYADTSAEEYAVYHRDTRGMGIDVELMNDRYMVDFLDHMGIPLIDTQRVPWGEEAIPPSEEVMAAYEEELAGINRVFIEWSKPYNAIKEHTTIIAIVKNLEDTANMYTVTFYEQDGKTVHVEMKVAHGGSLYEPIPPVISGYNFVRWIPNDLTNIVKDMTVIPLYEKAGSSGSSGSSSPSPSVSPSPSPSPNGTRYTVSVSGGSGSGSYTPGTVVTISAFAAGDGRVFDRWTTASTGVGFLDATSPTTTFTMPAGNVTVTATYKTALSASTGTGSSGGGTSGSSSGSTGSSSGSSSGTRVEVSKPGIPNTGLAAATVNGSLDNFVVKITEDPAATAAVVEALQNQYGDISSIRYLPMDISLYDSTGTTKITDTEGLSVNITLPLPSDLVDYAGNNRVAAATGGILENLGTRFTTIDGIPCVNFTATHFSPYTVYVDTLNLSASVMDDTPQTGDLFHPKWFLVMGLASISLLLFLKKDKKVTLITA